jgi:hypothetical protein
MISNEDFRAKTQRCLEMAAETTDRVAATLFHMLAEEYFDLAEKAAAPAVQQQQQIQPKKPEGQDR